MSIGREIGWNQWTNEPQRQSTEQVTLLLFTFKTVAGTAFFNLHESVKGILPQKKFYRPNLIFWIVMGCGKAHFGRKKPASRSVWVAMRSVRVASRSHVRVASRSQGTNFETKIFNFRCFFGPSDQKGLIHTPLLSKIWGLGERFFLVGSL